MDAKKQIRKKFRYQVLKRDNHKCVFCAKIDNLDVHHITDRNEMPNGGYVKENGITLCSVHHIMAEGYHISNGQEWVKGFHPDDLYKKIKSSKKLAIEKSKELADAENN